MNDTTETFARRMGERVKDANYASPIERFARPRLGEAAFGIALLIVIALVCWIGSLGFIFGGTAP